MKKYLCLLMALILCLSLWACGSSEPAQSTEATQETVPETTVPETTAPTPENLLRTFAENLDEELISALVDWQNGLQNGASFTVGDGWIYGMGTDNSGRNLAFVKCRTDCTDKTVLDKGWASYPNIKDGYIYYVFTSFAKESDSGLYRMRISGEGKEKLSDMVGHMEMWGDTIYMSYENAENEEDIYCLYAMDLDGSNVRKVIDKRVFHWFVFGDVVLYQDDQDNESLHLMDFDGNDTKLNDDISYYPVFDGEYIYYVKNVDEVRSIWRVDLDGQNDVKIADYHASNGFVLHKDKIYFVYQDDGDRIYSINKDGSGLTLISQDKDCSELQFMGDLLKYTDFTIQGKNHYVNAILLCDESGAKLIDFGKIK